MSIFKIGSYIRASIKIVRATILIPKKTLLLASPAKSAGTLGKIDLGLSIVNVILLGSKLVHDNSSYLRKGLSYLKKEWVLGVQFFLFLIYISIIIISMVDKSKANDLLFRKIIPSVLVLMGVFNIIRMSEGKKEVSVLSILETIIYMLAIKDISYIEDIIEKQPEIFWPTQGVEVISEFLDSALLVIDTTVD